jgi:hypothetical protein
MPIFRRTLIFFIAILMTLPVAAQEQADSVPRGRYWAKLGVQIGVSWATKLTAISVLKNNVSCMRPDGSDDNSFPSRHAAVAFSIASRISARTYQYSPWWVLGSQAVATGVGFERIIDRRHYPSDVMAGAVIGVGSAWFGTYVSNLIFPSEKVGLPDATNEFRPSIDMATTALFPVTHLAEGYSARTGFGASVRGRLPMGDNLGASVSLTLRSLPVYKSSEFVNPLNTFGLTFGVVGHSYVSRRMAFEYSAATGAAHLFSTDGFSHPSFSYTIDADCGATMQLTPALAVGANVGYNMMTMPRAVSMLSLSFLSRATF